MSSDALPDDPGTLKAMLLAYVERAATCCQRKLHCIGEDRSERHDIVPAQFCYLAASRDFGGPE
jgi:transposase